MPWVLEFNPSGIGNRMAQLTPDGTVDIGFQALKAGPSLK